MLNRCGSAIVASSVPHFQTHPVHADPRNIQAVTLHPYQYVSVQIIAKCREEMFRNIYDQVNAVINNELSNAPSHSAGTQNQMQSQVVRTSKCDGARGLTHGQQPQPTQTALHTVQSPLKHGTPPHGNKWSLARRAGEALKWRDHSHTIGRHAQWTKQYNGVRYLLQYAHWQTVHPQLTSISEWEERIGADLDLHEKLQKLQLTTTSLSNYSHISVACHDCPVIHRTSTLSFQYIPPRHNAAAGSNHDASVGNLQSFLSSDGRSTDDGKEHNAFPENANHFIPYFHQQSTKAGRSVSPEIRQKSMHKPKYNCKFTGCMQGKRNWSVKWISNDNQQSLCTSNGNAESLSNFSNMSRQFHSNANLYDRMQQCMLAPTTVPATADKGTSVTSACDHAHRTLPVMSIYTLSQQRGMSLVSPTTAYPPEIERDDAATNALYAVSMFQNVG